MPVWRPVGMSGTARETGWKPFWRHSRSISSLSATEKIFSFLRSPTVRTGCVEKMCTQPPCPQLSST